MPTVITGTDGINQVQAGAVESGDLPAGSVIQVVNATKTDTFSSTVHSTWVDFGLSVSVTPKKASSNWLVTGIIHNGAERSNESDWGPHLRAYAGSNPIEPLGDTTNNNRPRTHVAAITSLSDAGPVNHYLEVYNSTLNLTAGSPVTFSIRGYHGRDSGTWYINRHDLFFNDDISGSNPISTITIMEIAG